MSEFFLRGGPVMWPLLALSVLALALALHRFFLLARLKGMPGGLLSKQYHLQKVQHGIDTLYLIASIAPLLGLLGTVFGIIQLFSALSAGRPDPSLLSSGLSQALFTTAAGLIIAVPTQIAAHVLQQRLDSWLRGFSRNPQAKADAEKQPDADQPHE